MSPPRTISRRDSDMPVGSDPPAGPVDLELLGGANAAGTRIGALRAWLAGVPIPDAASVLWELDLLLEGLGCLANPSNHPGPKPEEPETSRDFRDHVGAAREALGRIVDLSRRLLGEQPAAATLAVSRGASYDVERLGPRAREEDSPGASLDALSRSLTNAKHIATGLIAAPSVSWETWKALLATTMAEAARSRFFAPTGPFELLPTGDRTAPPTLLSLSEGVPGAQARRLVAFALSSSSHLLRHLRAIEAAASERGEGEVRGCLVVLLAALRSRGRSLASRLARDAAQELGEGYAELVTGVPSAELPAREADLAAVGRRVLHVRAALHGIAASLRLELRRAFVHELGPDLLRCDVDALRARVRRAAAELEPGIRNGVLVLAGALGSAHPEAYVQPDLGAPKAATSARLRRDAWMFAQIARAFAAKARHATQATNRWDASASSGFVRELLGYFRAIGYPLLATTSYPRADELTAALGCLASSDLAERAAFDAAAKECDAFRAFLEDQVEALGVREELRGAAFDRHEAARALRLYLAGGA